MSHWLSFGQHQRGIGEIRIKKDGELLGGGRDGTCFACTKKKNIDSCSYIFLSLTLIEAILYLN